MVRVEPGRTEELVAAREWTGIIGAGGGMEPPDLCTVVVVVWVVVVAWRGWLWKGGEE